MIGAPVIADDEIVRSVQFNIAKGLLAEIGDRADPARYVNAIDHVGDDEIHTVLVKSLGSEHKYDPSAEGKSNHEIELERENAELRQAHEILKDALGFFAEGRRK